MRYSLNLLGKRLMSSQAVREGVVRKTFVNEQGKVLPVKGETNILVTSALPYVNNAPHLGNIIGSTLSADVYARYCRTRNRRTLYICGTDEYGTTTETKAMADGVTPRELCDRYHKIHAESYKWFDIGFDHFGRTSTPQQTVICQDVFKKLYDNGHLEERTTDQLYCEQNKKFLADRFVEGTCPICGYDDARGDQCDNCSNQINPIQLIKPRCKLCSEKPIIKTSSHLFIRLKDMQPVVEEFVKQSSNTGVWSDNAVSMTNGWLKGGLESRAMTRDLQWGVPVPLKGWENKVMYVWFDAPLGYPSITSCYTEEWERWWRDPENVKLYQFMGKDNVPFHTLLFPAYLIGSGDTWTKLNSVSTTEYLNYEGTKFSKSRNIGVFGENAKDTGVPASVWRYFLVSNRPETSDTQFLWRDFVARNNGELLNNLGNFVNRALKFINAKYDSVLPTPQASPEEILSGPLEAELAKDVNELLKNYMQDMDQLKLRSGLDLMMRISQRGNIYLQRAELGNELFNNQPDRCATVVVTAANLIYLLSVLTHPFMPGTEASMLKQLNAPSRALPETFAIDLLPGHTIGKADYLFKRIDPKMEETWRTQFGGRGTASDAPDPAVNKKLAKKLAMKKKNAQATFEGPKPPEMIVLEKQIEDQGARVRSIKSGQGVPEAKPLDAELESLFNLKAELQTLIEKLSSTKVTA